MARSGLSRVDKVLGTSYVRRFDDLHGRHITALRDGNLIVAHEVSKEIQDLSNEVTDSCKKYQGSDELAHRGRRNPFFLYAPPPYMQLRYYTMDTSDGRQATETVLKRQLSHYGQSSMLLP